MTVKHCLDHPGTVLIVPFVDLQSVVLVHQWRSIIDRRIWEFPAGTRRHNEAPVDAAIRECEEETKLSPGTLVKMTEAFICPGSSAELMTFYKGVDLSPVEIDHDEDEDITIHHVPITELQKGVVNGEKIIDLKTLWAIDHIYPVPSPSYPSHT